MCLCSYVLGRYINPYQGDSREDLQQGYEVVPIPQVLVQVCDVLPHLGKEGGKEENKLIIPLLTLVTSARQR